MPQGSRQKSKWRAGGWQKDYSVIQMKSSERDDDYSYIVFRAGTRYVSQTVPADYTGIVEICFLPTPAKLVRRRLKYMARLIERVAPQLYKGAELAKLIDSIGTWDGRESLQGERQYLVPDAASIVQECMRELDKTGVGCDIVDNAIAFA